MLVAVYGTLKRGYGNNRLLSSSEFLQEDFVSDFALFYSGSSASFPVAMHEESQQGSKIKVEVWNIGDCAQTLRSLDSLEGVPWMYQRKTVVTDDGLSVEMYVGNPEFWTIEELGEVPSVSDNVVEDDAPRIYEWRRSY